MTRRAALLAGLSLALAAPAVAVAHTPFNDRPALAGWPANWTLNVYSPSCNPRVRVNAICEGAAQMQSSNTAAPNTLDVCYALSTTRNGPYAVYGCLAYGNQTGSIAAGGTSSQFELQQCVWSETWAEGEVKISGTWRFQTKESVPVRSC
jgi:hypothetical protein